MRIVAGKLGGRRLSAQVPEATRPTSDRVREALGSALASRGAFEGAHVLDLFAGTGALGFEALSRGAKHLVAVEHDKRALRCIEENAKSLGVGADFALVACDLLKSPERALERIVRAKLAAFSLIFADPPYAHAAQVAALLDLLASGETCTPSALVVFEHAAQHEVAALPRFEILNRYRYGDTAVTLLARIS